jgi:hypothetical protein
MVSLRKLRDLIAGYRAVDWGLFALAGTLIAAVAVTIYARTADDDSEWAALSYFSPAQIIDGDGVVPLVPNTNYRIPSISLDGTIPTELVRYMDCKAYTCPLAQLPYELDSEWVLMDGAEATTTIFPVLEGLSASLVEGSDYVRGEAGIFTRTLRPQPIPEDVLAWIAENGGVDSTWKVRGTVTPLINNASTVAWATGVFVVVH